MCGCFSVQNVVAVAVVDMLPFWNVFAMLLLLLLLLLLLVRLLLLPLLLLLFLLLLLLLLSLFCFFFFSSLLGLAPGSTRDSYCFVERAPRKYRGKQVQIIFQGRTRRWWECNHPQIAGIASKLVFCGGRDARGNE